MEANNVAVFAGAGLSIPSGHGNWKTLLKGLASEIKLDVDKEHDLVKVAQYYVNESQGNKARLTQQLVNQFGNRLTPNENHKILADLPIRTYWTTNYDNLIEKSLGNNCKKVDLKITEANISQTVPFRDVVVYKMHGDITQLENAVITKDDYEEYHQRNPLFVTKLCGDIVSKKFLFLGFSFEDPNLDYILSKIRIQLFKNPNCHYCLMKKLSEVDFETKEEYEYNQIKFELKIKDLRRYGIHIILIDSYDEITEILCKIKSQIKAKNVFISGSAYEYGKLGRKNVESLMHNLSNAIIYNGNNIISGYGLGIGSAVISGAIEEIYKHSSCKIEERLLLRPFPIGGNCKELWAKYRHDMLSNAGIAIFVCGNKKEGENILKADGMNKEFQIALDNNVIPIPIPATEYVAKDLYNYLMDNFDTIIKKTELKVFYEELGKADNNEKIIQDVLNIINQIKGG